MSFERSIGRRLATYTEASIAALSLAACSPSVSADHTTSATTEGNEPATTAGTNGINTTPTGDSQPTIVITPTAEAPATTQQPTSANTQAQGANIGFVQCIDEDIPDDQARQADLQSALEQTSFAWTCVPAGYAGMPRYDTEINGAAVSVYFSSISGFSNEQVTIVINGSPIQGPLAAINDAALTKLANS